MRLGLRAASKRDAAAAWSGGGAPDTQQAAADDQDCAPGDPSKRRTPSAMDKLLGRLKGIGRQRDRAGSSTEPPASARGGSGGAGSGSSAAAAAASDEFLEGVPLALQQALARAPPPRRGLFSRRGRGAAGAAAAGAAGALPGSFTAGRDPPPVSFSGVSFSAVSFSPLSFSAFSLDYLDQAAGAAAAAGPGGPVPERTRAVLVHSGRFIMDAAGGGAAGYRGGRKRLMALRRGAGLEDIRARVVSAAQLSAEQAATCRIKYCFPSADASLMYDLETDEDARCMFEELAENQIAAAAAAAAAAASAAPNTGGAGSGANGNGHAGAGAAAAAAGGAKLWLYVDVEAEPDGWDAWGAPAYVARPAAGGSKESLVTRFSAGSDDTHAPAAGEGAAGAPRGAAADGSGSSGCGSGGAASSGGGGGGGAAAWAPPETPPASAGTRARPAAGAGPGGSSAGGNTGSGGAPAEAPAAAPSPPLPHALPPPGPGSGRGPAPAAAPTPAPAATSSGGAASGSSRSSGAEQHAAALRAQVHGYVEDLRGRVEVIRPWELQFEQLVGAGAFGEVHLARWRGSEVACKCLSTAALLAGGGEGGVSLEAVADLMREADILAGLRHPNIVAVFGVVLPECFALEGGGRAGGHGGSAPQIVMQGRGLSGASIGTPAALDAGAMLRCASAETAARSPGLVCEYLSAGSLRAAISKRAEWLASPLARVKLMLDTARGLEYLHSKQLCHFDLKSANVLIGLKGRTPVAKLCDFGLSKQRHATYVSGVTSLRGTLPWIAPEILTSPEAVTEKSDIYSFGVLLWELWTLREPFKGVPLHTLLAQLTMPGGMRLPLPGDADWAPPPAASGDADGAPDAASGAAQGAAAAAGAGPAEPVAGWEALVRRCWARDAAARPSARELVECLEEMIARVRSGLRAAAAAAARPAAPAAAAE